MNQPMVTELTSNSRSADLLLSLIQERTGYCYDNGNRERILNKIFPLVLERDLDSFLDYYYLLKYGDEAETEWQQLYKAISINETYFWREYNQIKTAVELLIPSLLKGGNDQTVRIWHAACATGEEPYTLAISLVESDIYAQGQVEIFATDFNNESLSLAMSGTYRKRSFRVMPAPLQEKYFIKESDDQYRLHESVRGRVQFAYLNLLDQNSINIMKEIDLIFCRNAFIYFTKDAIKQVTQGFYNSMRSPGYLFVGAAESLFRTTSLFELVEMGKSFVYKK
jgi:chemotaxis protein methyltransferase CheR